TRITEFYQRLEPYFGLLVLKDVRIAYGDGSGNSPVPQRIAALPRLLAEKLVSEDQANRILAYIKDEPAEIAHERGQASSVFADGSDLELKCNPSATFEIQLPDGQTQSIFVRGLLIKATKDWLSTTTQMLPVDVQ